MEAESKHAEDPKLLWEVAALQSLLLTVSLPRWQDAARSVPGTGAGLASLSCVWSYRGSEELSQQQRHHHFHHHCEQWFNSTMILPGHHKGMLLPHACTDTCAHWGTQSCACCWRLDTHTSSKPQGSLQINVCSPNLKSFKTFLTFISIVLCLYSTANPDGSHFSIPRSVLWLLTTQFCKSKRRFLGYRDKTCRCCSAVQPFQSCEASKCLDSCKVSSLNAGRRWPGPEPAPGISAPFKIWPTAPAVGRRGDTAELLQCCTYSFLVVFSFFFFFCS